MMGAMLAEHWRLPEGVGAIIGNHHDPLSAEDPHVDQSAVVQLADVLVSLLGYGRAVPYDMLGTSAAVHLQAADNAGFHEALETLPEVIELAMGNF